jgi:hypothetical protein
MDDWRGKVLMQWAVLAPNVQTNTQQPAGLPTATNQVVQINKVTELDNYMYCCST